MKNKFKIQDNQYHRPYHYFVNFDEKNKVQIFDCLSWGIEYYSYVSFVLELVDKLKFKTLAEVGCGDGKIIFELAKKYPNKKFEGYDLSEQSILFAKAYSNKISNLSFFNQDFKKSKTEYEILVLVEVLEHIPENEIENFIKTLSSKLVKGGKLIISVPTTNIKLHPKHYRHYDLDLLKKHTEKYFVIEKSYFIHNGKSKIYRLINIIFCNRFFLLSNNFISRFLIKFYNKYLKIANKSNGSHLIAILTKK